MNTNPRYVPFQGRFVFIVISLFLFLNVTDCFTIFYTTQQPQVIIWKILGAVKCLYHALLHLSFVMYLMIYS